MPEVIDLLSSDPPLPERHRWQYVAKPTRLAAVGLTANSGLKSPDSIDISGFTSDDFLDKPAKKRRVSDEKRSPPRHRNTVQGPSLPRKLLATSTNNGLSLLPANSMSQKKYPQHDVEETDPIVFTSSAPELSKKQNPAGSKPNYGQADVITLDDDDDDFEMPRMNRSTSRGKRDEIQEFSDPYGFGEIDDDLGFSDPVVSASASVFSGKTAALLSTLNAASKETKAKSGSRIQRINGASMSATVAGGFSDEGDETAEPRRPAKKSSKLTTEEKEARAKARADAKAKKDLERQLEKERKQKLKEEKAREKQLAADIAEVNKLKVDKKDSVAEMILDLSRSLEDTSVGNQALQFMKRLNVEHHFFASPIPNVIRWRRKMNARYNEEVGHWEPAPFHILEEKHVLCLVPAQDFVDMVVEPPPDEERESLEVHVMKIKRAHPDCTIIYLIEGLRAWMQKNSNSRNRAYVAEVRRQYESEPAPSQESTAPRRGRKSKRKPETTPPVDDDTIEDALLALQVTHSCLIHHTAAPPESAEWIKNFTEHVSTHLYRRERFDTHDAAFCMENGQVKPGDGKHDTFVKMLQEVNRVTASMAYGISSQYSCVTDLYRGMLMHGPLMLEDVRVCC